MPLASAPKRLEHLVATSAVWLRDRLQACKGKLLAGFLSRAVMKDCELSLAGVVERMHANYFLPGPDHQLNETHDQR